jgi:hypothetical protein
MPRMTSVGLETLRLFDAALRYVRWRAAVGHVRAYGAPTGLRERDVLEVFEQGSLSAGALQNERRIQPGPEHVSEAELGRLLVSVLQGGATEMREKHRPPDETVSTGLPRHMERRARRVR